VLPPYRPTGQAPLHVAVVAPAAVP
jgi:hypothetical protein